jgi:pimeloyl-ACP methyl ester carboxylesterase
VRSFDPLDPPETHYAKSGELSIAYQVIGEGPLDLVYTGSWTNRIEHAWELPSYRRFLERLASFSRLITFDKRGSGLSDRIPGTPTLEERMDDLRAVLDAVGSERAALFGSSEGGVLSAMFAASYPERTQALLLFSSLARLQRADDYPCGWTREFFDAVLDYVEYRWGSGEVAAACPDAGEDDAFLALAWSSGAARRDARLRPGDDGVELGHRHPSSAPDDCSPDARSAPRRGGLGRSGLRALPRRSHPRCPLRRDPGQRSLPLPGAVEPTLDEIERFLTGARREPVGERVLTTVLFTDVVRSTERAAELGDRRWGELLDRHDAVSAAELERFGVTRSRTWATACWPPSTVRRERSAALAR